MTLTDLARSLARPALWVSRYQKRLGLPLLEDYPDIYLVFLRKIRDLSNLSVSEAKLSRLWELERKLIEVLHLDQGGGGLSILAGCAVEADPDRRLLLSNADLGAPLMARDLQTGLDFTGGPRELFGGAEMGEDALRILGEYREALEEIRVACSAERKVLKETLRWERSIFR